MGLSSHRTVPYCLLYPYIRKLSPTLELEGAIEAEFLGRDSEVLFVDG